MHALQAFLAGRGAVSVQTALPLAAAVEAVTLQGSAYFIGAPAAGRFRSVSSAARDALVARFPERFGWIHAFDALATARARRDGEPAAGP